MYGTLEVKTALALDPPLGKSSQLPLGSSSLSGGTLYTLPTHPRAQSYGLTPHLPFGPLGFSCGVTQLLESLVGKELAGGSGLPRIPCACPDVVSICGS